jgi:N-[(2S)-2-amino-2-carboxyethyl]-L-glutamate dehydrogenase
VRGVLENDPLLGMKEAERAYSAHHRKQVVNPPSAFLTFPASLNRIIALQASTQEPPVAGAKLIASWPGNIERGSPRASAVIVLHDLADGTPFALIEAAQISSTRTAASAVLGARHLVEPDQMPKSVAVIGTGVIAARILETFKCARWQFDQISCFDLKSANARIFANRLAARCGLSVDIVEKLDVALGADLVIFATTAPAPYVLPPHAFRPGQVILNISLRDIAPEIVLGAENVVDDVDHCLRAETSPHLAEQLIGDRRFIAGTLGEVMARTIELDRRKPIIFSPFGLGVLDLTLAHAVWQRAEASGNVRHIKDFIGGNDRWA